MGYHGRRLLAKRPPGFPQCQHHRLGFRSQDRIAASLAPTAPHGSPRGGRAHGLSGRRHPTGWWPPLLHRCTMGGIEGLRLSLGRQPGSTRPIPLRQGNTQTHPDAIHQRTTLPLAVRGPQVMLTHASDGRTGKTPVQALRTARSACTNATGRPMAGACGCPKTGSGQADHSQEHTPPFGKGLQTQPSIHPRGLTLDKHLAPSIASCLSMGPLRNGVGDSSWVQPYPKHPTMRLGRPGAGHV